MRYTPGAGRQRIGTRDFQYDNRQDLNAEESAEERADALRRGHDVQAHLPAQMSQFFFRDLIGFMFATLIALVVIRRIFQERCRSFGKLLQQP